MAARYFCSKCGIQLAHTRKAVPGKGIILDLITPHECEGYAIKSNEFEEETVLDILEKAKPLGKAKLVSSKPGDEKGGRSTFNLKDERQDVRSAAPKSLLDAMARNQIDPSGKSEGD